MNKRFLIIILGILFTPRGGWADCTSPTGIEGRQYYEASAHEMRYCDGTNWQSMKGGITGQLQLGDDAASCSSTKTGTIRYNTTSKKLEFCDGGGTWITLASVTGSSSDTAPDAFDFTDLTEQSLGAEVFSQTLTISGFVGPVTAQVTGGGSPKLSVNGSEFVTSTQINPGDTLQIKMTTSSSVSTSLTATVTIGSGTDTWTTTTRSGGTRIFYTSSTYVAGAIHGLSGADQICNQEAAAAGYGGYWKAMLSDDLQDAASRLTIEYPVTNECNGSLVESTDLWNTTHEGAIRSAGGCTVGSNNVITGSTGTGLKSSGYTCNDYYGNAGSSRYGRTDFTSSYWTNLSTGGCASSFYLYCVSQEADPTPDPSSTPSPFTFTAVTNAIPNTLYTSNTITLSGFTGNVWVTVSGPGSPQFSVNGGAYSPTGRYVAASSTITLQMTTLSEVSYVHKIQLTAGVTSATWTITTQASGTKIFYTDGTYTARSLGGAVGANAICMQEAAANGYTGTWKALLSDKLTDASSMVPITYPVTNQCNGSMVELTDLWGSTHEGLVLSPSSCSNSSDNVITGTYANGTKDTTGTCGGWYTYSGYARAGRADFTSSYWINETTVTCDSYAHLYCVSVPDSAASNPANTPSAFTFNDLTNQNLLAQVTSNTVTLSGFTGSLSATVSGPGSPQLSVNGGAYTSGPVSVISGDTLTVQISTLGEINYKHKILVTVGVTSDTWNVTTRGTGTQIFYTASGYTGTSLGGLSGADAICATEAAAAGYTGTWKALLSDETTPATSHVTLTYPITNVCDGSVVEVSDIWGSTHESVIKQAGTCGNTSANIWTGTTATGANSPGYTCTSWSASGTSSRYGRVDFTSSYWINISTGTCSGAYQLYCVSQ